MVSGSIHTTNKHSLWMPVVFIVSGIIASFLWIALYVQHKEHYQSFQSQPLHLPDHLTAQYPKETAKQFIQTHWQTVTVKQGDTLGKIFEKLGLNKESLQLVMFGPMGEMLRSLKPKQQMKILVNAEHKLEQLIYPISSAKSLAISKKGEAYISKIVEMPLETRMNFVTGSIHDSLFLDAGKAGLTQATIVELSKIFAWDIDFAKDLRAGDEFSVIYEDQYRNGERVGSGHIVFAEFVNQNRTFRAVRYVLPSGDVSYYTPAGSSLKKAFLKTPVKFSRISSYFSLGRFHPILHRLRAHKGVDYAAPIGTPVRATANGRIAFRGQKNGYGNVVMLQHSGNYQTLYGHLSRFAHGFSFGSKVRQGDVIGYVGMTGLATGPHLHYEFLVAGKHRDPLGVKMAYAEPIPPKYLPDFKAKVRSLLSKIAQFKSGMGAASYASTNGNWE